MFPHGKGAGFDLVIHDQISVSGRIVCTERKEKQAEGDEKSPLFRSAVRRTGTLAATAMHRVDAWRMIQRRVAELGMKVKIGYAAHQGDIRKGPTKESACLERLCSRKSSD